MHAKPYRKGAAREGTMRRRIAAFAVCALASWLTIYPVLAEPVTPGDEETRRLLEKSLSVVEIDKEIARIREEQGSVESKLDASRNKLAEQENRDHEAARGCRQSDTRLLYGRTGYAADGAILRRQFIQSC